MAEIERVQGNVKKMIDAGAPEEDIDAYVQSEGLTPELLRQGGGVFRYIDNLVRQAAGGMTFGFADEMAAGADAAIGRGDYESNVARERARDDAFTEQNPKAAIAASIVGGAATGGYGAAKALGSQAVRQAPRVARALAYPAVGAVEGGIAGAGYGDEDRTQGAAEGAALGGAFGAAAPVVGAGLRKAIVDPVRAVVGRGGATTARQYVQRAMDRAGQTPEMVRAKMAELGEGASLVDTSKNAAMLGETVASRPGPAMEALSDFAAQRRGGQYGRVLDAVRDAVGGAGKEVATVGGRSPAFRAALDRSVPITPEMLDLMARPSMRQAWAAAQKIAGEDDIVLPSFEAFLSQAEAGGAGGRFVSIKTELLHYLKKGLDDVIEPKRNEMGQVAPEYGRSLMEGMKKTRYAFRELVKRLNPEYGKVLALAAREKRLDAAYLLGREYTKPRNTPGVLAARLKKMSSAEKRSFRQGMADAIEGYLGNVSEKGADSTATLLGQAPKLRIGFGKAADGIIKRLKTEQTFMRTDNAMLQNSRTALRQEARADFDKGMPDAVGLALDAGTGARSSLLAEIARKAVIAATRPPKAAEAEIANAMVDRNSGLNMLREIERRQAANALSGPRGVSGFAVGTGAATLPKR